MADYQRINGIRVRQEGIGERFGRAVQIGPRWGERTVNEQGKNKGYRWYAVTECDCGKVFVRRYPAVTSSCGCKQREHAEQCFRTHGKSKTKTHVLWRNMIQRCNHPKHPCYKHYGGRGIRVCGRWMRFENFLIDMGECPDGMSIDRIDNNRGYEPTNCRYVDHKTQMQNTRATRLIEIDGEVKCISDWLRLTSTPTGTFYKRQRRGLSIKDSLNWRNYKCDHSPSSA